MRVEGVHVWGWRGSMCGGGGSMCGVVGVHLLQGAPYLAGCKDP